MLGPQLFVVRHCQVLQCQAPSYRGLFLSGLAFSIWYYYFRLKFAAAAIHIIDTTTSETFSQNGAPQWMWIGTQPFCNSSELLSSYCSHNKCIGQRRYERRRSPKIRSVERRICSPIAEILRETASVRKISLKSAKSAAELWSKTIFNLAAVRHLEF